MNRYAFVKKQKNKNKTKNNIKTQPDNNNNNNNNNNNKDNNYKNNDDNNNKIADNYYRKERLERLIHKRIMKFLMDLNLLCDNQHDFRQFRSCVTQLLQLLHDWFGTLDKQRSVDVIFLDFAKAFDKVSHAHLLIKLQRYGIKGQILNWIRDFLTFRKQRVVIEGHSSDWSNVTSGVPQGSI